MYAEIVLSNPTKETDKPYHYSIPAGMKLQVGFQVVVSFGRQQAVGYVVGFVKKAEVKKTKPILGILSEQRFFDENSVELAQFMARRYCSFFARALRLLMPPGTPEKIKKMGAQNRKSKPSKKVEEFGVAGKGAEPGAAEVKTSSPFPPTPEQQKALDLIFALLKGCRPQTILLHGVTGSGKTEVYLQAVAQVLKQGQGAIILVPEIALTPQLIERVEERFQDHLAILHSGLTLSERKAAFAKVVSGEARLVLGTRTALFAPVKNLGIIILDEEYENTYKSDMSPRYHARTVAEFIARQKNIPLVLGSATPSLESFYKAQQGAVQAAIFLRRIDNRPLPPVEVVDMRRELKSGNFSILSRTLRENIQTTLNRREQVILFLNRLGYFTFVLCRDCGKTVECPKCSVSLSYYGKDEKLLCNRCGYKAKAPLLCPNCQSANIKYFGGGTSRVEREVALNFPRARLLRLDSQTVKEKGAHQAIYGTFKSGKADILIGTQLVTKGLDVANVTLVGVVAADTLLNLPDFRAAERTFQQITQVAGRAGRHHLPGKVIIQTYVPEHYAIAAAANYDYQGFYAQEMQIRQEVNFPPVVDLVRIIVVAADEKQARAAADKLGESLKVALDYGEILGPAKAPIVKVRGYFRYHLLIKTRDLDRATAALKQLLAETALPRAVKLTIDVDPQNML